MNKAIKTRLMATLRRLWTTVADFARGSFQERLLVVVATATLLVFTGIGVAYAQTGYYGVAVSGSHVAYVKNPNTIEAAVALAKEAHKNKTGQEALRPAEPVTVDKKSFTVSKEDEPLPMKELAERLSETVDWVVPAVAVQLPDAGRELYFTTEAEAHALVEQVLQAGRERPLEPEANADVLPLPVLESADAKLADLKLAAKDQPTLAATTFAFREVGLYDAAPIVPTEVPESQLTTQDAALAQNNEGRLVPHQHVLALGETREAIAAKWGMTPERLLELNGDVVWEHLAPGQPLKVERREPLLRDRVVVTEVREHYLPFDVRYVDDPDLMIGQYRVETAGTAGKKIVTNALVRVSGFDYERYQEKEEIVSQPKAAVVRRGTSTTPKVSWPLLGSIASPFGARTWADGSEEFHRGIDIPASSGTEVRAAEAGKVVFADEMGSYGHVIFVDHGDGLSTRYAHLSAYDVKAGTVVKAGDVIGRVGSTGNSTGPHLHFEVLINDEPKDPMHFLTQKQATAETKEAER